MSDGSVAPKERVNIVYKSSLGDNTEEVELPLKLLMLGDYTGQPSDEPVEERKPVNINKDNFDEVMKSYNLTLDITVKNRLQEAADDDLAISLQFSGMKDFSPDNIANQVPELHRLLELRKALLALKGPLGNVPAFRKAIQQLLSDETAREQLMKELGIDETRA